MPTLDDVINYILTTEELSDLPTISDALTERFATEMWLVADMWWAQEDIVEEEVEEAPVEEAPAEENLPPLSL